MVREITLESLCLLGAFPSPTSMDEPASGPAARVWYYSLSGTTAGPVSRERLREHANVAHISPETPVLSTDVGVWTTAGAIGLFGSEHIPPRSISPSGPREDVPEAPSVPGDEEEPEGLGGWLGFFGFGQAIGALYAALGAISALSAISEASQRPSYGYGYSYEQDVPPELWEAFWLSFAVFAVLSGLSFLFFKKSRYWYSFTTAGLVLQMVVASGWALVAIGENEDLAPRWWTVILIAGVGQLAYLQNSRRVRNTFGIHLPYVGVFDLLFWNEVS